MNSFRVFVYVRRAHAPFSLFEGIMLTGTRPAEFGNLNTLQSETVRTSVTRRETCDSRLDSTVGLAVAQPPNIRKATGKMTPDLKEADI